MKIRRRREFACGVLFTAVGLSFAWAAGTWPLGRAAAPGPGVLGLGLALALTMLGGFVLFMATSLESPGGDPFVPMPARPALLVLLGLLSFGVLLPRLGLVGTVAVGTLLARMDVSPGSLRSPPPGGSAGALRSGRAGAGLDALALGRTGSTMVREWVVRWRKALLALVVQPVVMAGLAWLVCHAGLKLHLPLWPLPLAGWLAG